MTKNATVPPASPLATFMKGLIDSKKFDSAEIVTDNPKRLSGSVVRRPHLHGKEESQRWESYDKIENECINCPQRRASIDDDDVFFSDFEGSSCSEGDDDDDDEADDTSSTPLPSAPLSPPFGNNEMDDVMLQNHNEKQSSSLSYQMALQMVQQKYAASSLSSPTQSPIQQSKNKLRSGIRGGESSVRG
ncbi:unnamed protein product [Cylindrotheca closterium]|uniref:Uncharacterized protein n=1 Tax=Cylindrotheca closterium TaxID=2856 RepID=A0AAD2PXV6_9STRA|nr:unnamed protein product [Cylindrotheca closterium]